jgi:hypothetical protein
MIITEQRTGQRFQRESRGGLTVESLIVEPYRRESGADFNGLRRAELEIARSRAMLAIVTGKMRMPSKRVNFDRLAAAASDPNVTLATLREIAAKLRVATQAQGTLAQRRSMEFRSETRSSGDRRVRFIVSRSDVVDRHSTRIETAAST